MLVLPAHPGFAGELLGTQVRDVLLARFLLNPKLAHLFLGPQLRDTRLTGGFLRTQASHSGLAGLLLDAQPLRPILTGGSAILSLAHGLPHRGNDGSYQNVLGEKSALSGTNQSYRPLSPHNTNLQTAICDDHWLNAKCVGVRLGGRTNACPHAVVRAGRHVWRWAFSVGTYRRRVSRAAMQAPYASASQSRSGRGKRRMSLRGLAVRLAVLDAENTDLVVATPHDLDSKHLRSRWNLQDELIRHTAEAGKLKQRTALGPVPHLTIEDAAVGENDLAGLQDFSKPRFRTPIGPRSFGRRGPSRVVGFRLAGFVRSGTSLCAASEDAREIMQIEVVCGERPADGPGRTGDFAVLIARQQWEQLHEFTSRFRRKHCGSLPFFCLSPLLMAPVLRALMAQIGLS